MSAHSLSVAVVTGANSGIGRATAIHLAQNGYRVFGTVRNIDKATKAIAMASAVGVDIEWVELDIA
ncbi:MAG: SDR family NAD(P)-dependent oxidoreductase, partial [Actinobacteria bacterium]|nr:SDR family NAD(P)-dependent oxidoreductase [Actinomycetota bacterium]